MVKTPRTRGAKRGPQTIDLAAEDVTGAPEGAADAPPGAGEALTPAETRFAAEESLTPGEGIPLSQSEPLLGADAPFAVSEKPAGEPLTPEAAEAADSFRFSRELPTAEAQAAETAGETGEPRENPSSGDLLARDPEVEGPVPGDAATPLFTEAPPSEEEAGPSPAPAAAPVEPPPVRRRGAGAFLFSGFVGGVAALLLAGLLQYLGTLPSVAPQTPAAPQVTKAELDGLRSEVAALREQAANMPAPAEGASTAALDTLRTEVEGLKTAGGDAAALAERLGAVEQKVEALGAGAVSAEQVAALGQQATAAGTAAREAGAGVAEAVKRVEALEGAVNGMKARVDALAQQPRVALALAAAALRQASDRGAPFEAELAALSAVAPNLSQAEQLKPYAASGVPTRQAIGDEWSAAADAMFAAANPADPDAGLMSRLLTGAGSLVSVRPVGAVEGTDPSAVIARMEAAVKSGDLAKALAEYDALPEPVKAAGAAWADKARARLAVEGLIDGATAEAMKGA